MSLNILIIVLLTLFLVFILLLGYSKRRLNAIRGGVIMNVNGTTRSFQADDRGNPDEEWWKSLRSADLVDLSLSLCRKCLPLWDHYSNDHDVLYKDSATGPVQVIRKEILLAAIDTIELSGQQGYPGHPSKVIQAYSAFIGPVVAMQDGHWLPPYAIKKLFLSVYHLLRFTIEQSEGIEGREQLFISIVESIDCLHLSRICDRNETQELLQTFRHLIPMNGQQGNGHRL